MAEEEEQKLKTIWEYLASDRFNEVVYFPRFEECFKTLFKNENISLQNVFDFIVGVFQNTNKKRKYISYTRLYKAYLKYKNRENISKEIITFFDKLLNSTLKLVDKGNNYLGEDKGYNFFSSIFLNDILSRIVVLSKKENDNIIGLRMEYNNINENIKMYKEENVYKVIDLELNELKDNKDIKNIIRDGITHIFGTYNKIITSIGFKCISGKIIHFGKSEGESFLFGSYGKKLQCLDLKINENGISGLKLYFIKNIYVNLCIEKKEDNEDEIYYDEEILLKEKDPNKYEDMRKNQIINIENDENENNEIFEGEDIYLNPSLVGTIYNNIENDEHYTSTIIIEDKTYSVNENPFFELNPQSPIPIYYY